MTVLLCTKQKHHGAFVMNEDLACQRLENLSGLHRATVMTSGNLFNFYLFILEGGCNSVSNVYTVLLKSLNNFVSCFNSQSDSSTFHLFYMSSFIVLLSSWKAEKSYHL